MILKPCPFCRKDIPRAIQVCPYCHRDEKGCIVQVDSTGLWGREERAVKEHLQLLQSGSVHEQEKALHFFRRHRDERAVMPLIQLVRFGEEPLRFIAIQTLVLFSTPEVLKVLIEEAERPHPYVQPFLAFMLGESKAPEARTLLNKLVKNARRTTAFQAAWALGQVNPQSLSHYVGQSLGRWRWFWRWLSGKTPAVSHPNV